MNKVHAQWFTMFLNVDMKKKISDILKENLEVMEHNFDNVLIRKV